MVILKLINKRKKEKFVVDHQIFLEFVAKQLIKKKKFLDLDRIDEEADLPN